MIIPFYKMTGAGNDFVMVDNRDLALSHILTRENIARLCNRRFGIGADGLIAIEPPQIKADVRMRYYNADGGEAEMCGNGASLFHGIRMPFIRRKNNDSLLRNHGRHSPGASEPG